MYVLDLHIKPIYLVHVEIYIQLHISALLNATGIILIDTAQIRYISVLIPIIYKLAYVLLFSIRKTK